MKLSRELRIIEKKDFQIGQLDLSRDITLKGLSFGDLNRVSPELLEIATYLSNLAPKKKYLTVDVIFTTSGKMSYRDLNWRVDGDNDFFAAWVFGDPIITFANEEIPLKLINDSSVLINDLLSSEDCPFIKKGVSPPRSSIITFSSRDVFRYRVYPDASLRGLVTVRSSDKGE